MRFTEPIIKEVLVNDKLEKVIPMKRVICNEVEKSLNKIFGDSITIKKKPSGKYYYVEGYNNSKNKKLILIVHGQECNNKNALELILLKVENGKTIKHTFKLSNELTNYIENRLIKELTLYAL